MRKLIKVDLSNEHGFYTELTLPAPPYTLLDTLEKLKLEEGESPEWVIADELQLSSLADYLNPDGSLFELNALCQQLALLNEGDLDVVEGLAKLECEEHPAPIPIPRLIDMAYSTDCCYRVEEAVNDETLGRFCAQNDFVPEVDSLSDEAFELLDFAKIGQEFRHDGGGVFTSRGYVQRHSELRQAYQTLDLTPKKPDYTILVQTASGCEVSLPCPLGEPAADGPVRCLDCAAPVLTGMTGMTGMIGTWDMLAHRMMELEVDGELPKYKAVLCATRCDEPGRALELADELDQFSFSPQITEYAEVARARLAAGLSGEETELILPKLNLYGIGKDLLEHSGGRLTGYGLVQRGISPMVQNEEQEPTLGEMRML